MIKQRALLLILMMGSVAARAQQRLPRCHPDLSAMTAAVTDEIFDQDVVYQGIDLNAGAYLRIIEEPQWKIDNSYYQIRLVKKSGAGLSRELIVKYEIPKGSGSIYALVKKALGTSPCLSAHELAAKLPIRRTEIEMAEPVRKLAATVFDLKLQALPIRPVVREDATKFTLEVIGENRLRVSSDDHELEFVRWIIDLENAIDSKK